MESVLLGIAVLACPVGMGLMMWLMGRRQGKGADQTVASAGGQQQVEQLRAEIEQLKAERAARRTEDLR
jgi:hypothetical protein